MGIMVHRDLYRGCGGKGESDSIHSIIDVPQVIHQFKR